MAPTPLRRLRIALRAGVGVAALSLRSAGLTAPYVPFPAQDTFRKLQLEALACARDNTAAPCDQTRALANPLLDHPRLPASCKDLIWSILQNARPGASNSFARREGIADPAGRLLLVCRSAEKPPQANPTPAKPGGGLSFGGG